MPKPILMSETSRLRSVTNSPGLRIKYTMHCLDEMRQDDILAEDAVTVLRRGTVTWIETKKDVLWHVEGRDVDDRRLRFVAAVYEQEFIVKLITAMLLK